MSACGPPATSPAARTSRNVTRRPETIMTTSVSCTRASARVAFAPASPLFRRTDGDECRYGDCENDEERRCGVTHAARKSGADEETLRELGFRSKQRFG